ncbi:MAG: PD-(D/E)XK nuclease family protein [Proteobacteria bacterium]|nr:PD-(D/E)XK nuclease family protein [Pseudomonadota bacterium]
MNFKHQGKDLTPEFYYLAYDKELSITRSRKEVEEIRKETIYLIKQIEKTTDFRPNQSGLCGWCDYSGICPAMGHEVNVEPILIKKDIIISHTKRKDLDTD